MNHFLKLLLFVLFSICFVAQTSAEETCNCDDAVAAAVAPLQAETAAWTDKVKAADQRATEFQSQVHALSSEKDSLQQEVDKLRRTLDNIKSEATKYHQQADENARASADAHGKLAESTSKLDAVSAELSAAHAKIEELESISFSKQLSKELTIVWQSLSTKYAAVKEKFMTKKKENEDL